MIRKESYTIPAKPAVPEQKAEHTYYTCDICGRESKRAESYKECVLCKRLVCMGWSFIDRTDCCLDDPREFGDYPDHYCKICHQLKFNGKYDKEFDAIEEKHYADLEKLDQKIKDESLATVTVRL